MKRTYFTIITLIIACAGNSTQAMQGASRFALTAYTAAQSLKTTFARTFSTSTPVGLSEVIDHKQPDQEMITKRTNRIKALTAHGEVLDQRYAYAESTLNDAYESRKKLTGIVMSNTFKAMDLFPVDGRKRVTLGSRLAKSFKDGLIPGSPVENTWDNIYAIFHNSYRDLIPLMTFFYPSITIWKSKKYQNLASQQMVALDALERKLFTSLSAQEPSRGDTRILERNRRALNEKLMRTIIERATLREERLSNAQALKAEQSALDAELDAKRVAQMQTLRIESALQPAEPTPTDDVGMMTDRILQKIETEKPIEKPKNVTVAQPKELHTDDAAVTAMIEQNHREYYY